MTGYIHYLKIKVIQEGIMTLKASMIERNNVKQQLNFMQEQMF